MMRTDEVLRPRSADALEFAPSLLAMQEAPPSAMPRAVLYSVTALLALLLLWAALGHLDIVASADGRLIPETYLKVVQPADAGIVKEILVHEGQSVTAGDILLRLDAEDSHADLSRVQTDVALRSLQLRRVRGELSGVPLTRLPSDPPNLYTQVFSQYRERRQAYLDSLEQAQAQLRKTEQEYDAGTAVLHKLEQTNPLLKAQSDAYTGLGGDGYVARVTVSEKQRAYIENSQDLSAQQSTVQGLAAAVKEAHQQVLETQSKYRSDLQNEWVEAEGDLQKLQQDLLKQQHRASLLDLRAPQSGIVKDLATHTVGTVVSPGTVLLSIVPENEPLVAEVTIRNDDVGFVHAQQTVKLKLAAYPFQKYGLLDGKILHIWPDANDAASSSNTHNRGPDAGQAPETEGFKALVSLDRQSLQAPGQALSLVAGMQVIAEIREGRRTVLQYLLSPIQGALHDGGRER